eukprot:gene8230-5752_t
MAHNKEVVKVVETATQLQQELELAQAQHGVCILDIYNAEWGPCKALNETFRRLFTDAGDDIYIRFFAVECNKVLETYRNPDPHTAAQTKQKTMEYHPDTFPECWEPILESRQNHSKPFFLYYKEGKIRARQEGVDTPKIYKFIRSLCTPQKPASEFITNESLMNFWLKYFSEVESEVTSVEFFRCLVRERSSNEEFTPEQIQSMEVFAECKGGMISAEGLQKWTGERDFMETVAAVVPDAAPIEPYPEEEPAAEEAAAPSPEGEEGEAGDAEGDTKPDSTEGAEAPADGGEAPADGGEAPAEAPADGGEAPTEAPADGGEAPAEAPVEAPADGGEAPAEAPVEAPAEAPVEAPADGGEAPAETPAEAPVDGGEAPSAADAAAAPPAEESAPPAEEPVAASAEPAEEAAAPPAEAPAPEAVLQCAAEQLGPHCSGVRVLCVLCAVHSLQLMLFVPLFPSIRSPDLLYRLLECSTHPSCCFLSEWGYSVRVSYCR